MTDSGRSDWEAIARAGSAVAVQQEREACMHVASDIFIGNTEIPTRDSATSREWRACAEFIYVEIEGRQ
jgi:hypothetical protein